MSTKPERLLLLDLLKLMTLFAIQTLHVWEFIFYQDDFILPGSVGYEYLQYYARVFSLGGQVLVGVIYLLFGLTEKSPKDLLRISAIAVIGQLALTLVFMEEGIISFEWDIYVYIAVTNILLLLLPRGSELLMVISFSVLLIPPALFENLLPPGPAFDILVGRTGRYTTGAWALLPWFFHAALFFNAGLLIRTGKIRLSEWHRMETFLWPVLFFFSLPFLGHYFMTPIGPRYYMFNFHEQTWYYWANFLPFVFWMRIAFLDRVKRKLETKRSFRWISTLQWNRNLGLCYILGVLYVGIGMQFDVEMKASPLLFDTFYLSIMPVVELAARLLVKLNASVFRKDG